MKQLTDEHITQLMANCQKHPNLEVVPYSELAMRLVKIPDEVEFYVPVTPGSTYVDRDGTNIAVTATTRKLRGHCFGPEPLKLIEHTHPDGDTTSDVLYAEWAGELAWDISHQLEIDVKTLEVGFARILWAPYLPPFLSPTFLDPKEFSIHRRPMYRYGKKMLP